MRILGGVLVAGLLMLACSGPALADNVEFRMNDGQLACLRDNSQAYLNSSRDPLFIPLDDCPNLPAVPFLGNVLAEAPTSLDTTKDNASGDTFIYVTKSQFQCLVGAIPPPSKIYVFYPQTCQLEPGN
jgi:hypothetical protein